MGLPSNPATASAGRQGISLSNIYLSPVASLDGVSGYQHHCPELGDGLFKTLEVLPRRR